MTSDFTPHNRPSFTTLTDAECRQRRNRWNRRYRSLEGWLVAHPGEAAGRLVGPEPTITYYMGHSWPGNKWRALWTAEARPPCEPDDVITEAQYREFWAMPPAEGKPDLLPQWPATPEKWNGQRQPTKPDAIKRIKTQMRKLGVTLAELSTTLHAEAAYNGPALLGSNGTTKPLRVLDWKAAGWSE